MKQSQCKSCLNPFDYEWNGRTRRFCDRCLAERQRTSMARYRDSLARLERDTKAIKQQKRCGLKMAGFWNSLKVAA
jgi:hypothetical protein